MEQEKFIIDMLIKQWEGKIKQLNDFFELLDARTVHEPVAPGKNKIVYILGHLLVINDRMIDALELGNCFYPELDELFLQPEHAKNLYPDFSLLMAQWEGVHFFLSAGLKLLSVSDWLSKPAFENEFVFLLAPTRNKLNVLMNSIAILSYHQGQLALTKDLVSI